MATDRQTNLQTDAPSLNSYLDAVEMEYLFQLLIANLLLIGPEKGVLKGVLRRHSKRPMLG